MVKTRQRITVARGVAQSVDVHVPSHSWKYADGTPCSELTRGSSNAVGAAAGESASEGEAGSGKDSQPMVEWTMNVGKHDIAFSVEFIPGSTGTNETQPAQVVQHKLRLTKDQNAFTPESELGGILRFTFDNKYSMMRGKEIDLSYEITENPWWRSSLSNLIENSSGPTDMHRIGSLIHLDDSRSMNHAGYHGVKLFFENRLEEAEQYFFTNNNRFPIFSLGYSTMAHLKAMMTWAPEDISNAVDRLEHTKTVAEAFKPKTSMIGRLFGSKDPTSATSKAAQVEASLITAEATLVRSLLHLMEETMMGFVRAGLAVRSGWKMYNECDSVLAKVVSSHVSGNNEHTESFTQQIDSLVARAQEIVPGLDRSVVGGIQFGLGTFNLVISVMPPIILRIVEALGFPSDKNVGISHLKLCMEGSGVRSPLAALMMLTYHVLLPSFIPTGLVLSHHSEKAENILRTMLGRFNDSALFLWISGRLERMRRNIPRSIEILEYCSSLQHDWIQLRHLCAYELGFCEAFRLCWEKSANQFRMLEDENTWSKPFYGYMQAVSCQELGDAEEVKNHLRRIREYEGINFSGKKISIEQFVDKRSEKILSRIENECNQGLLFTRNQDSTSKSYRVKPVYSTIMGAEVLYLFNGFSQMERSKLYVVLQEIDSLLLHWCGLLPYACSSTAIEAERKEETPLEETCATTDFESCTGGVQVSEKLKFSVFDLLESATERSYSENVELASKTFADSLKRIYSNVSTDEMVNLNEDSLVDAVAVVALCRGALLSQLEMTEEAHACLDWVLSKASSIQNEHFVIPFARYEKAVLHGSSPEAAEQLKAAKAFASDYNFKIRLHLRIHLLQIEFAIGEE